MTTAIIIPAVKKNVAFRNDLVKKLGGILLIQRAIDKARMIVKDEHIYVVTDSEEICLICRRNGINEYYNRDLILSTPQIIKGLEFILSQLSGKYEKMVLLSPYVPLLQAKHIQTALKKFTSDKNHKLLISVKREASRVFKGTRKGLREILVENSGKELLIESQGFKVIGSPFVENGFSVEKVTPLTYEVDQNLIEIRNYQDWWVCEKLLARKRIVFRIIGDELIGMGHIYRALTLAHEITDHEVYLVCDEESRKAVTRYAGNDYWLGIFNKKEIADRIIDLKPDLVINDILKTKKDYILKLRKKGISVINFEDLGSGASHANLTINELYDKPTISGKNILWGRKYFFLREEFGEARPNRFKKKVDSLLVTFGAADPSDFTRRIFHKISNYCAQKKIKIFLVTGGGYSHIEALEEEIKQIKEPWVQYVHITGVMSHLMEQVQIAIASNGRTVYELAHMNIPSIILSHHKREEAHSFASPERGFIPLGVHKGAKTDHQILEALKNFVEDHKFREDYFERIKPFSFHKNKEKALKLIFSTLNQ